VYWNSEVISFSLDVDCKVLANLMGFDHHLSNVLVG